MSDKLIKYKERNHEDPFDYELGDLIFRGDAMEAVENEDNLHGAMDSVWDGEFRRTKRAAVRVIAGVSATDAVPVVRCKDCKHFNEGNCKGIGWCKWVRDTRNSEWYCAAGERRES